MFTRSSASSFSNHARCNSLSISPSTSLSDSYLARWRSTCRMRPIRRFILLDHSILHGGWRYGGSGINQRILQIFVLCCGCSRDTYRGVLLVRYTVHPWDIWLYRGIWLLPDASSDNCVDPAFWWIDGNRFHGIVRGEFQDSVNEERHEVCFSIGWILW